MYNFPMNSLFDLDKLRAQPYIEANPYTPCEPIVLTYAKAESDTSRVVSALIDEFNARQFRFPPKLDSIELPVSKISSIYNRGVSLGDVFKEGFEHGEPLSLSLDNSGAKRSLDATQRESFKTDGTISVASQKYPGHFHVWKVANIVQKGSKFIQDSFENDLATSIWFILGYPAVVFSRSRNDLSIPNAFKSMAMGLRNIISLSIGIREMFPVNSENQILELIRNDTNAYVSSEMTRLHPTFNNVLYRNLDDGTRAAINTCLCDIETRHGFVWGAERDAMKRRMRRVIRDEHPEYSETRVFEIATENENTAKMEQLIGLYRSSKQLESILPGYAEMYANSRVASIVKQEANNKLYALMAAEKKRVAEVLKTQNPILSRLSEWLEPKVNEMTLERFMSMKKEVLIDEVEMRLQEMGLVEEASLTRIEDHAKALFNMNTPRYTQDLQPTRRFVFEIIRWNRRTWESKRNDRTQLFELVCTDKYIVESKYFAWRLSLMTVRFWSYLKNGLFWLAVNNLWFGELGVKALTSYNDFSSGAEFNSMTGVFVDGPRRTSFASSLRKVWRKVAEARHSFESAPDNGLLGKGFVRPFHIVYRNLRGALSTAVQLVVWPIMTIVNFAVSILLFFSAPVVTSIASVAMYILDTVYYDRGGRQYSTGYFPSNIEEINDKKFMVWQFPSRHLYFPIFNAVFYDVLFRGIGQCVFTVFKPVLFNYPVACIVSLYATLRMMARSTYDFMIRSIVLNHVKVPGIDTVFARRTQGPGMAGYFFHQANLDVIMVYVMKCLENKELNLFVARKRREIDRPVEEYNEFFNIVAQPFGKLQSSLSVGKLLYELKNNQHKLLQDAVNIKQRAFQSNYVTGESIRIKRDQFQQLFSVAVPFVESFYRTNLLPLFPADKSTESFWTDIDLEENDFNGFVRHVLKLEFGDGFLVPLEEQDRTLRVEWTQREMQVIFEFMPYLKDL